MSSPPGGDRRGQRAREHLGARVLRAVLEWLNVKSVDGLRNGPQPTDSETASWNLGQAEGRNNSLGAPCGDVSRSQAPQSTFWMHCEMHCSLGSAGLPSVTYQTLA